MTSSTKPEVHNILHCCLRRIEPQLQVACTENLAKFGSVVLEICERTDRQTDTLIAILRTRIGGKVKSVTEMTLPGGPPNTKVSRPAVGTPTTRSSSAHARYRLAVSSTGRLSLPWIDFLLLSIYSSWAERRFMKLRPCAWGGSLQCAAELPASFVCVWLAFIKVRYPQPVSDAPSAIRIGWDRSVVRIIRQYNTIRCINS